MPKKYLFFLMLILFIRLPISGQTIDSIYQEFKTSYKNNEYENAIIQGETLLKKMEEQNQTSDSLYLEIKTLVAESYQSNNKLYQAGQHYLEILKEVHDSKKN